MLQKYDLELEKARMSVWAVTDDATREASHPRPAPVSPKRPKAGAKVMTARDIMREYGK